MKPIVSLLIKSEDNRTVRFSADDGKRRRMTFLVADVNQILVSVVDICDNGSEVTFTATGGKIASIKTGRITKFRRHGHVYVVDIWFLNPNRKDPDDETKSFSSQGLSR